MRAFQSPAARGAQQGLLYDARRPVDIANIRPFPRGMQANATISIITASRDRLMQHNRAFPTDDYKTQSIQNLMGNMAPATSRGQGDPESNAVRWEQRDTAFYAPTDGVPTFLSYTFFPAVLRLGDTVTNIPYVCIYSSHPINAGMFQDYGMTGSPGPSEFATVNTVMSQYGNTEAINVYRRFIADESAQLSILSALTNTAPMTRSFVYILPWVSRQFFDAHITRMGPNGFNVGGPSMGLAVAAAVLGCQPIMYTGQLANFGDRGRLPRTDAQKAAASDAYGLYPSRNFTIVEDVQQLGHKMSLAVQMGIPIVLPFKSQLGGNIQGWLENARMHDPGLRFLLESVGAIHTAADIEDGVNFRTRLSPVYMCVTLMDCAIGAANQWYAHFAMNNIQPTSTYLEQAPEEIGRLEDQNYRRVAPLKARAAIRAKESAELRKRDPQQWVTDKRAAALQKIAASTAKKQSKVLQQDQKQAAKARAITAEKKQAQKNINKQKLAAGRLVGFTSKAKRQSSSTAAERQQRSAQMLNAAVQRAIAQQQVAGGGAASVGPQAIPQPPAALPNRLPAPAGDLPPDFDLDLDDIDDVPNVFDQQPAFGQYVPPADDDFMDDEEDQVAGGGARATMRRRTATQRANVARSSAGRSSTTKRREAASPTAKRAIRAITVGRGPDRIQTVAAALRNRNIRTGRGQAGPSAPGAGAAGVFGAGKVLNQHWDRKINREAPVLAAGLLGDALDLMF